MITQDDVAVAQRRVSKDRIAALLELVLSADPSTGREEDAAFAVAGWCRSQGMDAHVPLLAEGQRSVYATHGDSSGQTLLLYAPLDTMLDEHDLKRGWPGAPAPPYILPSFQRRDDLIVGHGANNPLGHAISCVEAAAVLAAADLKLPGRLALGLGAAGMPVSPHEAAGAPRGHGAGCAGLLREFGLPAAAIIAKPGRGVNRTEVGINWFAVDITGAMNYTGIRHYGEYNNPILIIGTVIDRIEELIAAHTSKYTGPTLAPQGSIGAVTAGWPEMASFSAPVARIVVDLRGGPEVPHEQMRAALDSGLDDIRGRHAKFNIAVSSLLSIPGTETSAESLIVRSSIQAWEWTTGEKHVERSGLSGATDANILRAAGVPTVRMGMPPADGRALTDDPFMSGMNVVDLSEAVMLSRSLVAAVVAYFNQAEMA